MAVTVRTYKNSTVVRFDHPTLDWDAISDWLEENCVGEVEIHPGDNNDECPRALFELTEDALLFSLKWI
jgi:hypothetical protein